jgi:hypothetical protein
MWQDAMQDCTMEKKQKSRKKKEKPTQAVTNHSPHNEGKGATLVPGTVKLLPRKSEN